LLLPSSPSSSAAAPTPQPARATPLARSSAATTTPPTTTATSTAAIADAKAALYRAVRYTRRGANAPREIRGEVADAQAALEALAPPQALDFERFLPGKWRLLYTTASDVLPILGLNYSPPPLWPQGGPFSGGQGGVDGEPDSPFRVGDVFQRFSALDGRTVGSASAAASSSSSSSGARECGICENIIEFSVKGLADRAVFRVLADCDVRTGRRLALTFREAALGEVSLSPALDGLLAPALLPRGYLSMRALQEAAGLALRFPFNSAAQVAGRAAGAVPGPVGAAARDVVGRGAPYLVTYLDEDIFIGVSTAPSGSFIFERVEDDD
jgi:hypothetical protein